MKLVLAGGSSHSDAYVESLRRHESDRIRFLPWVSGEDLDELLSNAALFVLPSDLEGLSLALLDAMAAGVCVLTSDIPENSEVVDGVRIHLPARRPGRSGAHAGRARSAIPSFAGKAAKAERADPGPVSLARELRGPSKRRTTIVLGVGTVTRHRARQKRPRSSSPAA